MTGKEKKEHNIKGLSLKLKEDLNATQRIARDISNIAQVLEGEKGSVRGSDLMACAGDLHHYFTAFESIFERISRAFRWRICTGWRLASRVAVINDTRDFQTCVRELYLRI